MPSEVDHPLLGSREKVRYPRKVALPRNPKWTTVPISITTQTRDPLSGKRTLMSPSSPVTMWERIPRSRGGFRSQCPRGKEGSRFSRLIIRRHLTLIKGRSEWHFFLKSMF